MLSHFNWKKLLVVLSLFVIKGVFAMEDKDRALVNAAGLGNNEAEVERLIKAGAHVDGAENIPLVVAASMGHLGVVRILLDHRANVNQATREGRSALMQAAQNGNDQIVQLLLENGADVNIANAVGVTPLIIAAENGHLGVVQILLDHGANVNAQAANGTFALRQAAESGHLRVVEALLTFVSEADGRAMRERYFVLASSMKKKPALGTSADTRRLVLQNFIDVLVQERMNRVLQIIALRDYEDLLARLFAIISGHHAIADLLDLNNPESREIIRSMIEANIRRAIKLLPTTQGISWDEALGTFEPREEEPK